MELAEKSGAEKRHQILRLALNEGELAEKSGAEKMEGGLGAEWREDVGFGFAW